MTKTTLLLFALFLTFFCFGQTSISERLKEHPKLATFEKNAQKYKLQIIYTQIDRDSSGNAFFKTEHFRPDATYFYPASLVKLPTSIIALEKLKELSISAETSYITQSGLSCQKAVEIDKTSANGRPSIMQYIKKMALVSDNFGFGRVLEMVGVNELQQRLSQKGFTQTRITHHFDHSCKGDDRFYTNPGIFINEKWDTLYTIPLQKTEQHWLTPIANANVGKNHIVNGKMIQGSKDFSTMNYLPLEELHEMMLRLIFPESFPENMRFDLRENDRQQLMDYLTIPPRLSKSPLYSSSVYPDNYKKYFIYGDQLKASINDSIQITNIVGQSYGFLADCAYICDKKNDIEFMLSAVIYVNENEVINDGIYEYKTVGLPFLGELGRHFYQFEKSRKAKTLPY